MILRTSLLILCFSFIQTVSAQSFGITFKQKDQIIRPDSLGRVYLKKDTFVIVTALDKLDGVFVNSSYDSIVYQGALQRKITDFQTIGWKVSVETEFNKDQELFLQDQESYCYWFYDPKEYDWHRFDSVIVRKGSTIIGTKTIRQLYALENKQNISIKDLPKKPIYLSFFSTSGSFAKENAKLEQVQCFILYFED
ncbi:MAG: hypothetical protein RLZZ65_195 [Bacteroidota bacterium]|jgi:hypothetical protein